MSPWHTERMISDWMNSVDGALLAVWLRGLTDCSIVVAFWVSGTWGASTSSPAENTKSWLCLTALLLPAGSQRQCSRRDKITKVLMSCIRQVLLHWSDSTWETVSPICINYWMDWGGMEGMQQLDKYADVFGCLDRKTMWKLQRLEVLMSSYHCTFNVWQTGYWLGTWVVSTYQDQFSPLS